MNTFADTANSFIDERPDAAARRQAWSVLNRRDCPLRVTKCGATPPLKDLGLEAFTGAPQSPRWFPIHRLRRCCQLARGSSYVSVDGILREYGYLRTGCNH